MDNCCAIGCTNRFKKKGKRSKREPGFHRFPADPVRRNLWILALGRKNFEPTRTSIICGEHFQTGRPSKDSKHPDYVPSIFAFKPSESRGLSNTGIKCEPRDVDTVNDISVEEVDDNEETFCASTSLQTREFSETKYDMLKRIKEMRQEAKKSGPTQVKEEPQSGSSAEVSGQTALGFELLNVKSELRQVYSTLSKVTSERDSLLIKLSSAEATHSMLQNCISEKENELSKVKTELQQAYEEVTALRREKEELQTKVNATDITQNILQNPNKLRYYTGLNSFKDFNLVLSLLSNVENSVKSISLETQVLILLMKLKLNLGRTDLALRFRVSTYAIQKVCLTLIPPLEEKLDLLVKSPVNNALRKNIPVCFKNTVYENLYQRLHKNSRFDRRQSDSEEADLDIYNM